MAATAGCEGAMGEGVQVVLFVEDEYLVRVTIAEELRDAGYEVVEAGNAAEAMRVLEAPSQRVDVLLTDVQMPGTLNGLQLARWSREHRPDVVVSIWSGAAWAVQEARTLIQPDLVFAKPVRGSTLAQSFRRNLPPADDAQERLAK